MSERNMSIVFSSGISALTECNASFDSGVLRVCYTGKNRNNSFISKETFERCIHSIYNCPIVCRYDRETDTIGAHDMELVGDDNGMRIVNVTHPVGVIPESAQYRWEEIEDESGLHEYLCVDALIWKRQEAYQKIKEDGITDESMEITVKEGEMIDGVYVIRRFEFTAFCLLGTVEPCYEGASLEVFSRNDFMTEFNAMMEDCKKSFSLLQSREEDCVHTENFSEGGEAGLNEKKALADEYGVSVDGLGFSLDDFTLEELRVKFEEMKHSAPADDKKDPASFALEGEFRSELYQSLESEMIETSWGTDTRYWFWDYDRDASEVYAYDVADWNLYGFPFAMDGDRVVVHFDDKKRMKMSVVPFDEGSKADPTSGMFSKLAGKCAENNTAWEEKYQAVSTRAESMESELEALRKFKAETESAIANGEREKVFARFGDLSGLEAFEKLRGDCDRYSAEELEEKCFAIRGRNMGTVKFSHEPQKAPKLPVEQRKTEHEPYGGVFEEYGIRAKRA